MEMNILNIQGKESGSKASLNPEIFEIVPNEYAMYQMVRLQRANQRQGTHDSKGRSYVSGGGKKPFKQKGTGNARQGTTRAPHMVGGGRVFGPQPRDYGFKLNKKYKKLAKFSALSLKVKQSELIVLETISMPVPKTKELRTILKSLNIDDKKVLILTSINDKNLYMSARNIPTVNVMEARNVNVYELLNCNVLLVMQDALEILNKGVTDDIAD